MILFLVGALDARTCMATTQISLSELVLDQPCHMRHEPLILPVDSIDTFLQH